MNLRPDLWSIVSRAAGCILLVAAGLKQFDAAGNSVDFESLSYLLIVWQIGLGAWLLWGVWPRLLRLAGIVTFAAFAAGSLQAGAQGRQSWTCFGVEANPWMAFIFELGLLSGLTLSRIGQITSSQFRIRKKAAFGAALFVLLFIGAAVLLAFQFGSLEAIRARLLNEPIRLSSPEISLGNVRTNAVKEFSASIVNKSGGIISIIGGTSECSCMASVGLPMEVADGETADVMVRFVSTGKPGRFRRVIHFFTDGNPGKLSLVVTGNIEQ